MSTGKTGTRRANHLNELGTLQGMDPFLRSKVLKYYKRPEIQNAIVDAALDKEIAVSYGGKGYGKRPDTLAFPNDVLQFVKNGATSFHCSEELWSNPLAIRTGMSRKEADELRKGWDLVLDIDCVELEYARVCAIVLLEAIKYHGVKSVFVKFSGNNGYHIAIPFEAFPKVIQGQELDEMFPEGPRKVALYLQEFMRKPLKDRLLEKFDINDMAKRLDKPFEELVKGKEFDPYEVMHIDTVLISSRHLYRMPYSMHEKSGLVSVPLKHEEVATFQRSDAEPHKVQPKMRFIDRASVTPGEASNLLVQSFDFVPPAHLQKKVKKTTEKREFLKPEEAIPEDLFPPCIQRIFMGLEDGKKRAMFITTNFLKCCGWEHDKIEERLHEWNKANPEPIREVILKGHLRHHKNTEGMPPSCSNKAYYKDLGVCHPDNLCSKIKNPVAYAKRKAWALQKNAPKRKVKPEIIKYDVVDEEDKVVAKKSEKVIFDKGLAHRTVQVLVLDPEKKAVLVGRRPNPEGPSTATSSVSGMVRAGEKYEDAARRILDEELKLRVILQQVHSFATENVVPKRFVGVFICYADKGFRPQESHVWLKVGEIQELIDKGLAEVFLKPCIAWLDQNKEKLFGE